MDRKFSAGDRIVSVNRDYSCEILEVTPLGYVVQLIEDRSYEREAPQIFSINLSEDSYFENFYDIDKDFIFNKELEALLKN